MKSTKFLFATWLTCSLVACSTADSPILKQARTMQESILKDANVLDSTVGVQITALEATLTDMTLDTTLNTDEAKKQSYVVLKEKYNELLDTKTRLDNWRSNITLLPTPEEIAKGAENPFGKGAKDEDVLTKFKSAAADLAKLKSDALSSMD